MYDELLKFAVQLAKAAGGIQLAYFRGDRLSIETKSNVYDVETIPLFYKYFAESE